MDQIIGEARRLKIRLTKDLRGKRIKLSKSELKTKIKNMGGTIPDPVKDAKKLIKMCQSLMIVPAAPPQAAPPLRAPPPPPPPPPRAPPPAPLAPNPRGNLMAALKLNLARRGLNKQ